MLIGYYKKTILRLKKITNQLHENPSDIALLRQMQEIIFEKIMFVENKIQKIKKRKLKNDKKIGDYRYVIFILKCFGDAIANIYISKHNLKQLSYNINNEEMKHPSGFISGKKGFELEKKTLFRILAQGIPCVLCDITNNIRYGDICILVGNDPEIIECKANNSNNNMRARRQEKSLKSLGKFYLEDSKKIKKGLLEVKRKVIPDGELNYQGNINMMIEESLNKKKSIKTIEKGLIYSVYHTPSINEKDIEPPNAKLPWVFILDDYRNEMNWLSYYPFVLSITDPENLFRFIVGDILIIVTIDVSRIKSIATKIGLKFEANKDSSESPFEFYLISKDTKKTVGMFAISSHMITRIALEFVSLKWLIENSSLMFFGENMQIRDNPSLNPTR